MGEPRPAALTEQSELVTVGQSLANNPLDQSHSYFTNRQDNLTCFSDHCNNRLFLPSSLPNMHRKIIGIGILVVLIGGVWFSLQSRSGSGVTTQPGGEAVVPEEAAIDVTSDFFTALHQAAVATSSDQLPGIIAEAALLSTTAREQLTARYAGSSETRGALFCQSTIPPRVGLKPVYETDTAAQFLLRARGMESTDQAIVTVEARAGAWLITDITCGSGEVAPEREFQFDQTGQLLRESAPAPLDVSRWHLVFLDLGGSGQFVPLYFGETSQCTDSSGDTQVCDESQLSEADSVRIQASMTESGAEVQILTLVD